MKTLVRLFFRTLRVVLGPFMLLGEWLTRPAGIVRAPEAQAQVKQACRELALYEFRTCPFCIKVRQEMRRLSLPIELRDARADDGHRDALLAGIQPAVDEGLLYPAGDEFHFLHDRIRDLEILSHISLEVDRVGVRGDRTRCNQEQQRRGEENPGPHLCLPPGECCCPVPTGQGLNQLTGAIARQLAGGEDA